MNRKFFLGTMGGERRPPLDPEDLLVRLKKRTLYQGGNKPTGFRMILEWEAQKDLERYLQAEKFRVLLGSLEVLGQEAQIRYSSPLERGPRQGERRINPAESMAASIFHDSWCPWKNRV